MNASLSKKRQKELDQLRTEAEVLLQRQQDVLSHATVVAKEAGRQAAHFTREEVAPRLRGGYENFVAPNARKAASQAGEVINNTVIPAVGTVLGTALSVADVAKDARVQAAVKRLGSAASDPKGAGKAAAKAVAKRKSKNKKKGGAGSTIALLLGLGALAGVVYAVWQTFRADDELWVADDQQ